MSLEMDDWLEQYIRLHAYPKSHHTGSRPPKQHPTPWTASLAIVSYGVRFQICANDSHLLQQCLCSLSIGWRPSSIVETNRLYSIVVEPGGPAGHCKVFRIYRNARQIFRSGDRQKLFDKLNEEMIQQLAAATTQRVFIRAGVVSMGGRALLFPGGGLAGKTTLVEELVRNGATYYSDEFAVIDSKGRVHPYARPLSHGQVAEPKAASAESQGLAEGRMGRTPVPVGLVILSRYRSGVSWRPKPISPGTALLAILDYTVCAERSPETKLKILKQVVSQSFRLKGTRGEAREVAEWISGSFRPHQVFSSQS